MIVIIYRLILLKSGYKLTSKKFTEYSIRSAHYHDYSLIGLVLLGIVEHKFSENSVS